MSMSPVLERVVGVPTRMLGLLQKGSIFSPLLAVDPFQLDGCLLSPEDEHSAP